MAAIEKAYSSYIAPECFPTCVLFLEMNPGAVDVNVHPAKLEVKFSDERVVFESIYYTVKAALEEHEYRPEMSLGIKKHTDRNSLGAFVAIGEDTKGEQISIKHAENVKSSFNYAGTPRVEYAKPRSFSTDFDRSVNFGSGIPKPSAQTKPTYSSMTPKDSVELLQRYGNTSPHIDEEPKTTVVKDAPELPKHKIIGEAFDCYVIVELDGELLIIDKHAAHERVIFEDLKKSRENDGRVASQSLLLPLSVILTPDELSIASEFKDELTSVGFEYAINNRCVDITAIPDAISITDAEGLFVKMADELIEGRGNPEITEKIRREKSLYQIACKAAIKGGRVYDRSVIEWLVTKILQLPDITVCPHGRPIAYKLKKSELDRQFDRIK